MKYFNVLEFKNFIKNLSLYLSINENDNKNFLCLTDVPELIQFIDVFSYNQDMLKLSMENILEQYKFLKIYTKTIPNRVELFNYIDKNSKFKVIGFNSRSIEIENKTLNFNEIILDIIDINTLKEWSDNFKCIDDSIPSLYIGKVTFNIDDMLKEM